MGVLFERLEVLLMVACIVAIVARSLQLPYTVGLVVTGLLLASLGIAPETHLSRELIFTALLPPLIFEAAIQLPWSKLKPELPLVVTLATAGVFIAGIVTTLTLVYLGGQSWQTAIIIGVILSATDPVSVLALLKQAALPSRIHRLIESESLFNDGTAAVLFTLAPIIIAGGATVGQIAGSTLLAIIGGVATGFLVGGLALIVSKRTEDHLVEITVTVVAAYASFLIAEELHVSGVLSTLTAGMILGNLGDRGAITAAGQEAAHTFWEFAGFIANSLIFLLIGIDVFLWREGTVAQLVIGTILASLLGRAFAIYLGCLPFKRSKLAVPRNVQHLLVWGGLRGALSLALVLGLPESTPDRSLIISTVFYTVAFSIIVQGLSVGRIIKGISQTGT